MSREMNYSYLWNPFSQTCAKINWVFLLKWGCFTCGAVSLRNETSRAETTHFPTVAWTAGKGCHVDHPTADTEDLGSQTPGVRPSAEGRGRWARPEGQGSRARGIDLLRGLTPTPLPAFLVRK